MQKRTGLAGGCIRRLLLAGGGTGGHLMPGVALAEELQARHPTEVLFVGSEAGIERRVLPELGYELATLPDLRFQGGATGKFRAFRRIPIAIFRAMKLLRNFRPDAVVGLGGYAAFAPLLGARILGIPSYLLEQNVIPGRTNRLMSRFVRLVFNQFDEAVRFFPRSARCTTTGSPLRKSLIEAAFNAWRGRSERKSGAGARSSRVFTLLVIGGSQGARPVNRLVTAASPELAARIPGLKLIHIAGRTDADAVRRAAAAAGIDTEIIGFTNGIEKFYSKADLVLARAGATSLAEICLFGLPAVLIPYPHARDDHQAANARCMEQAGAAVALRQEATSAKKLAGILAGLSARPGKIAEMSRAAKKLSRPDAAAACLDAIAADLEGAAGRPPAYLKVSDAA